MPNTRTMDHHRFSIQIQVSEVAKQCSVTGQLRFATPHHSRRYCVIHTDRHPYFAGHAFGKSAACSLFHAKILHSWGQREGIRAAEQVFCAGEQFQYNLVKKSKLSSIVCKVFFTL